MAKREVIDLWFRIWKAMQFESPGDKPTEDAEETGEDRLSGKQAAGKQAGRAYESPDMGKGPMIGVEQVCPTRRQPFRGSLSAFYFLGRLGPSA